MSLKPEVSTGPVVGRPALMFLAKLELCCLRLG